MAEENSRGLIMEMNVFAASTPMNVRIPKVIAEIVICGVLHIKINEDTAGWIPPTAEQKENLKKTFEY
jgi:hypothetical protein